MKTITQYKFLRTGLRSENGNLKWKIGEWQKVDGKLEMCSWGLHSSKDPYDAFSHIQGEILAVVECRGKHLHEDDKDCWQEQRIVKAYKWTKKDSLKLAIFSAELCLKNFEKYYPEDKRPREAIESAKKVLFKNTKKNRDAAESAARSAWSAWSAARSAWSAESAAESAAWSAESAAWSAWSAARSAWSAESAARSAWSAESAIIKKIQNYFLELVKDLKPYGKV